MRNAQLLTVAVPAFGISLLWIPRNDMAAAVQTAGSELFQSLLVIGW